MISRSLGHRAPLLWLVLPMLAGLVAARNLDLPVCRGCWRSAPGRAAGDRGGPPESPRCYPALLAAMFLAGAASYAIHRPTIPPGPRCRRARRA